MKINIPGFWFMSWYDVSVGPNLALYNHVRKTASPEIADKQYAVIAPTLHCSYTRATEDTVVGERHMSDARLDYSKMTYDWFDHFLKGENNDVLKRRKYSTSRWAQQAVVESWPPAGAEPMVLSRAAAGQ
jgi:predicted acyl esterase